MIQTHKEAQKTRSYKDIIILVVPLAILLAILIISVAYRGSQQFSDLAHAFLHGHLNFLSSIGGVGEDPVLWHGKIYWGEGPFPAILLMPFVAIFSSLHSFFYQGYLSWILVLGVLFFVFKLGTMLTYSKKDSLILSLGFVLGSVFIGVATLSSSWYFAQVLTTFLVFWGLYEYYRYRRWWLIGIICGLIFLTRTTAAPIVIFFALELWQSKTVKLQKIKQAAVLFMPLIIAAVLIGLYNFLRFNSPFNGGYAYQLILPFQAEARSYGIFSPIHIPTNLYSALLRGPIPVLRNSNSWTLKFPYIENNPYGMSIFITSPYLLYLFTQKWASFDSKARNLLVATLISAILIFSFYFVGFNQFGYRYALDFMPELFLLFMILYRKNHSRLSKGIKLLLLGAGIINFFLLWTFLTA